MVADCKERLNNLVIDGVILSAVYFNILAEMPSWPLALDTSRDASRSYTSDSCYGVMDSGDGSSQLHGSSPN